MDSQDTKNSTPATSGSTPVTPSATPSSAPMSVPTASAPVTSAPLSTDSVTRGTTPQSYHRGAPSAGGRNFRDQRPGGRKGPGREPRAKPEFDQKMISIRRVTRVASGGRRFSFSVAIVAGNRKGSVGVGTGKAIDTSIAIDKAFRNAKKHMIKLALTKEMSLPYEVNAKYCSSRVTMKPSRGKGLVAGSSVRSVLELAGVKNVTAKLFSGTKNSLNNARAAVQALSEFKARS